MDTIPALAGTGFSERSSLKQQMRIRIVSSRNDPDLGVNAGADGFPIPARETADGLVLAVRLTPKAARDDVTGVESGADGRPFLTVRVKAVPEKGKANAALVSLIARWLDLPKSDCALVSGGKSRLKQVLIKGDARDLKARLAQRMNEFEAGET
jgi:uncharacterized protein (TIGR00251 family)